MSDDPRRKKRPQTINEELLSVGVMHAIGLERLAGSVSSDMNRIIESGDKELERLLDDKLPKIVEQENPAALSELEVALREIDDELRRETASELEKQLADTAEWEAEYQEKSINEAVGLALIAAPAVDLLRETATQPIEAGETTRTAGEWVDSMFRARDNGIINAARDGYLDSESDIELVREKTDRLAQRAKQHSRVIAQTTVIGTTAAARELVVRENRPIEGVQWVSVLDHRTSEICAQLDTEIFKPGRGPRPPAHANCRSTTITVLKSWEDWGVERDQIPPDVRQRATGRPATAINYEDWLDNQAYYVIEEALGVQRAKLYVHGGLSFDELVTAQGKPIPLKKLRAMEPKAWERAEDAVSVGDLRRSRTYRQKHFDN